MGNETRATRIAKENSASDARQSPFAFYLLAQSYFASADRLALALDDKQDGFAISFDDPVRHLYAHGWELALKACLFQQGILPSQFKVQVGHSLLRAWDKVRRENFEPLHLTDNIRDVLEVLEQYHGARNYAYPERGSRFDFSFTFLRAACQRFNLPRNVILSLFGDNHHDLGLRSVSDSK